MEILTSLQPIVSLLDFILGILVLIKLFKREGWLKGILGIIIPIYTFIWGWIHINDQKIHLIMYLWTATSILLIYILWSAFSRLPAAIESGAMLLAAFI